MSHVGRRNGWDLGRSRVRRPRPVRKLKGFHPPVTGPTETYVEDPKRVPSTQVFTGLKNRPYFFWGPSLTPFPLREPPKRSVYDMCFD